MIFIKTLEQFLKESKLTHADVNRSSDKENIKEFIKDTKRSDIWEDIFAGQNRLYFDMDGRQLSKKDLINKSKTRMLDIKDVSQIENLSDYDSISFKDQSVLKDIIIKCLTDMKYVYIDYINNKCSKYSEDKNVTTISGVLNSKLVPEKYKPLDLLNRYNQRSNMNYFNKPIVLKKQDSIDYMMVFSNHPVDMLTMSSNRSWEQTSCMRISGSNHDYVYDDIEHGSVVCFQTTMDDFNINKANARILFKPYVDVDDEDIHILYGGGVYGDGKDNFNVKAQEVVNDVFNGEVGDGVFDLHCSLYNDNQPLNITKKGDKMLTDGITLENFYDEYTVEDATVHLFDKLKNEAIDENNGSMLEQDIEILATVFNDIYHGDGIDYIIITDYLDILGSYDARNIDFKNKMFPILDEIFTDSEYLFVRRQINIIENYYLVCLKFFGDSFLISNKDKYDLYVFRDEKIKYIKASKYKDDDEQLILDYYEKFASVDSSEYIRMKKIKDKIQDGKISTPYFEIKIESYMFKDNKILYICDIKNLKTGKISKSKIYSDSLIQYIFGHGTIVEKKK